MVAVVASGEEGAAAAGAVDKAEELGKLRCHHVHLFILVRFILF